jgi:hypothetical protein
MRALVKLASVQTSEVDDITPLLRHFTRVRLVEDMDPK